VKPLTLIEERGILPGEERAVAQQQIRVLTVEDEEAQQGLVREWLSREMLPADEPASFDVRCCSTLADGLKCLGRHEFDVVLLDLHLPDSHGTATCKKMLAQFPERPIVVLSGLADSRAGMEAVQCGAQDYLVKGKVGERTLSRTLRYAIQRHRFSGPAAKPPESTGDLGVETPYWDSRLRELRLGRVLVKRFRQPSANQERILAAFQEEGWPERIDDPLPPDPEHDPKERLRATVKALNRNQQHRLIRFQSDGRGQGVLWEPVGENPGQ